MHKNSVWKSWAVVAIFAGVFLPFSAQAAEILVTDNISTSGLWTSDNTYNLQDQIFVLPGATLTIEAGTLVQSTAGLGGSLAVCRGAQIYINGTSENPVIMTSTNDDFSTWREACNELGQPDHHGRCPDFRLPLWRPSRRQQHQDPW